MPKLSSFLSTTLLVSLFAAGGGGAALLFGQAGQVYRSDNFLSNPGAAYTINGPATFNNPGGLRVTGATAASVISTTAIPVYAPNVQVTGVVALNSSGDTGTYVVYARASSNALYGPSSATGTFLALVVQANVSSGVCSTSWTLLKKGAGGVQTLWTGTVDCLSDNYQIIPELVSRDGNLYVYNFHRHLATTYDSENLTGTPGFGGWGMSNSSGFPYADMFAIEYVAPTSVPTSSIAVSTTPGQVDFQFPGTTDPAPSSRGMAYYILSRAPYGTTSWSPIGEIVVGFGQFADKNVSAGTSYAYKVDSFDYCGNSTSVTFNATTPPAGSVDPRRVGVAPNAPLYGALGANVDLLSGNLNYNLPLLKAQARGGWGVTFGLNYDSQFWKKEGSTIWNFGVNRGYGFGWRVMAGSVTRYYASSGVTSHIVFTDSTGTEYKLDRKVNPDGSSSGSYTGWWAASSANFYGIFNEDWNTFRMKFPDGSFWEFGQRCRDVGEFGIMYPTKFQDSNGNQVLVHYHWGSSRIQRIEDVRAVFSGGNWGTYDFSYDASSPPHLTSITNRISTSEGYTFNYSTGALYEPFTSTAWPNAGSTKSLTGMTISGVGLSYTFEYHWPGTGELSRVTLPTGGYVKFDMGNWLYTGSRTLRDVWNWGHSKDGTGGSVKNYYVGHEGSSTDGNRTLHAYTYVSDASGTADKYWVFNSSGLVTQHYTRVPSSDRPLQVDSTWTTDANGKPYIGVATTTYDVGKAYQVWKRTEQTLDVYGNLTQMKVFDWGNSSTARRVYTNTYLATSGYVSAYIRNRLLTTTYSENGGSAETMVSHEYDNYAVGCASGVGSCAITATSGARQKDSAFGTGYTLRGNITSSFVYGSGSILSGSPSTWAWRLYDDTGNVVKTKSPQGIVGTAVEDSGKNFAVPQSITVAGLSTSMNWNSALGLTSASGPNGVSSGTVYDSYARPASKTSPTGAVTTFTYSGNVTTATTNGRWVKTTVDGFGRPRLTETGYSGTTVSVVENEYEPCACTPIGKLKRTTRPYAPGGTKYWTVYNYDALGRTVSVVAPDGASTTSYVYEGNTVKTTDAAGKWRKFTQDAVGNLTQVNEPNPAGGADYVTTYTYTKWDQLTGVSMPRPTGTQTRTFNYSGSTLQSKTEPETGTTSYYYKSDGRLDYTIDAKSQRTEYKYEDDLLVTPPNRRLMQIRKVIGGTEDLCQRVELLYDNYLPDAQFDAGVSSNGSGRLTAKRYKGSSCTLVGGHTYVEQYSYTTYGAQTLKRLKVIRNVSGGGTASGLLVSTAEYDGEGRLLAVTYPVTGKRYQYGFDSRGLPSTLTNTTDSVTVVSGVSYGVAGEMTTFVSGGGTETRSYNVNGQLTTLNLPGRTVTYNFPAAGSNNGKVSSVVDSGETISYLYDSLQRLTSATGSGWSQTFSYDGFGNMTGKVGTGGAPSWSGAIDPATNRLSGVSFDANGNQLALPMTSGMPDVFTATYDASNRMIYVENPTQSRRTWYEYDAGNKRVYEKRVDGSTQEWFHYFGITGQRLARYSFTVSGAVITFAEHENSVWFGGKLVRNAGSWTNEDRLGSVGKYLPYGEDKPGSTNPASDSVKFATYTRDAGTGIDYADQRWHAQGVGRFLTSDPYQASAGAEDPGSWNRYGYVGGDPVGNLDSTGEKKCNPDEQNTCVDVEGSTTVLSYIWRTSLPTVVPTLDPNLQGRLYAAPYQRARKWQAVALNPAAENHVNDCQALANFAEDVAWDMIAQGNTSFESFIQAFGSFVPAGNGMVAAANSLGFNISAAANPASWTPLNNGNVPSGFARAYQDSQNGNPNNNDQSHHFAAFLQFGYQAADLLGAGDLSATLYDLFHNNFGDIALGIVAADLGRALRLSERSLASGLPPSGGLMTPLMMASEIRKLCK